MTTSKEVQPEIDVAVRRLIARYTHLTDDRDFDALGELFSEDARFVLLGFEMNGRGAIVEKLSQNSPGIMHQVTNVLVSNGSHDDTYHAISDVTALTKGDDGWKAVFSGRYHDTLAGTGREMCFTQRILTGR